MTQRREREDLCPLPAAGHTSAPTAQADPRNTLQYQQVLLPPIDSHTKPQGSVGLSPLFNASSVALFLFCQAQQFLWGPCAAPRFAHSAFSHASSRASQEMHSRDGQADAESDTRAKSFQQTQMKGYRASSPSTQGSSGPLLQGRMEGAVPKGRAVAPNAPQAACVTAAKQSPCALRQTPTTPPSHPASV